jgi:hypothetical protein
MRVLRFLEATSTYCCGVWSGLSRCSSSIRSQVNPRSSSILISELVDAEAFFTSTWNCRSVADSDS